MTVFERWLGLSLGAHVEPTGVATAIWLAHTSDRDLIATDARSGASVDQRGVAKNHTLLGHSNSGLSAAYTARFVVPSSYHDLNG